MWTVQKTDEFDDWLRQLADQQARQIILTRILRVQGGNFGDCEPVGQGVSELRIDHGPGYRVYLTRIGKTVQLLISGGTKATQAGDIEHAIAVANQLKAQAKLEAKKKERKA